MNNDLHNDGFFRQFAGAGIVLALLGLLLNLLGLLLVCLIVYFFLAAAGIVPPMDFIPMIPYV